MPSPKSQRVTPTRPSREKKIKLTMNQERNQLDEIEDNGREAKEIVGAD
jgi:hypothetical protein